MDDVGNLDIWNELGKTNPSHTKTFKRAGGFSGTAIKPMWAYKRMTEKFGPIGKGWGVNAPTFQVVQADGGEVLVYCTVSLWYEAHEQLSWGVGGDKAVGKNKYGLNADDEAFKKAFTDAITNALKMIGVGADVHMGQFDDNKYVNTMKQEFAAENMATPAEAPKPNDGFTPDNLPRKTKAQARDLFNRVQTDIRASQSQMELQSLMKSDEMVADLACLPQDWETLVRQEAADLYRAFNKPLVLANFDNLPQDTQEAVRNAGA